MEWSKLHGSSTNVKMASTKPTSLIEWSSLHGSSTKAGLTKLFYKLEKHFTQCHSMPWFGLNPVLLYRKGSEIKHLIANIKNTVYIILGSH